MKKTLLLSIVALGLSAFVNGQTTPFFQEDFEGNIEETEWQVLVANGAGAGFGVASPFPAMTASGFTGSALFATTFATVNDVPVHIDNVDIIFLTPPIVLPEGDSFLKYRSGSLLITPGDQSHYSVYVVNGIDLEGVITPVQFAAMLDTKDAVESATISGDSSVTSLSLTEYAGQTVLVAFRLHDSTDNTMLLFDDVTVTEGSLNTADLEATANYSIYPNPATNLINILGNEGTMYNTVTITDINGRTVSTKQLNGTSSASVDVSGLNSGMYIMKATSDKGIITKKFIKQ